MTIVASRHSTPSPDRVRVLVARLHAGWRLIDDERDPARRSRLEDHWIRLLREYEAAIAGEAAVLR